MMENPIGADLAAIVAAASTLAERLEGTLVEEAPGAAREAPARLDTWREVVAKGDEALFARRLALDGLTRDQARAALGPVQLRAGAALPAWTRTLHAALAAGPGRDGAPLLARLAQGVAGRLATCPGYALLAPAAAGMLDAQLRARLQACVPPALQGDLAAADPGAVVRTYPALARLLATIADGWAAAGATWLGHLAADAPLLAAHWGVGPARGPVTAVDAPSGHTYGGAQRVLILTWAGDRQLVYKPRDLGLDVAYNALLAWLNAAGAPLPFRVLTVRNQGTHGWMEWVAAAPPADAPARQRYYRRAGMLLCLVHALRGTDCHRAILIPAGEYPVLVDASTLFHHRAKPYEEVRNAVSRTGFLPTWQPKYDGRMNYDPPGLGEIGAPEGAGHYAAEVRAGYQAGYRFLLAQRPALLAPAGPLQAFARQPVRFHYRAPQVYTQILQRLTRRPYLGAGVDRSLGLELLGRALVCGEDPPRLPGVRDRFWPVVAAEQRALAQGDLPCFTTTPDSAALTLGPGQEVPDCFFEPSLDAVRERIAGMDERDLVTQTVYLQSALYVPVAAPAPAIPPSVTLGASFRVYDGYGSMGEYLAVGLARAGAQVNLVAFSLDLEGTSAEFQALAAHSQPDPRAPVLYYYPPCWELARFAGARALFINTMFETSRFPAAWVPQLNTARAVIVPTRFVARACRESGVTVPIAVAAEGIDPAVYHYEERPARPGLTTLLVGTLVDRKNAPVAIAAWKQAFAGDPTARLILKCRFQHWKYEPDDPRIRFVDSDEATHGIAHWYRQADVLLALGSEGFGLPMVEAMATGLPVVALSSEGQGDVCEEAPDCLLPVPPVAWVEVDDK
ncbi:MAG TPA: DUF4135 domain-containing protein, partial [Chloroflexia bacterium]|nr:DUF4135 domain-containing protein [Chloroflexia bacterium]